ncbi:longevity assurance proteins LAG1/LAC1 [Neolentinus lepideus HHB14362 ss-1]|uniref:Longevity assurance proteins LAG1/LAC1 n=1 Tax=Neolentinus lepideus HHB14362 ss-1 TaxID=1314782 RepID=A0A165V878_9AGAM|nr:longevity assurance proteins LAG1/LAC1 [Neolentinus lepideus HHB14362 ss-1]
MNVQQMPQWIPSFLVPFFTLSYPTERPVDPDSFPTSFYYKTGPLDACFIITCIAVMAVVRDAVRLGVFEPFARWKLTRGKHVAPEKAVLKSEKQSLNGNGVHEKGNGAMQTVNVQDVTQLSSPSFKSKEERRIHRSVLRFAEQGYSFVYYGFSWCFGMYVHMNLGTQVLNPTHVWLNYPNIPVPGEVKAFYLIQTAFYLHQVLILNAEARRKDHWQMMTHHILTIALVGTSYFYNFTRVGCMIMVIMDWCDIFLPLAKMFRYLEMSTLCDATFVFFMLSWFATRHVLFVYIIRSTYYDMTRLIKFDWAPERGHRFVYSTYVSFVSMLVALQVLQMLWTWRICRTAWRVVAGKGAEDERSDDEE